MEVILHIYKAFDDFLYICCIENVNTGLVGCVGGGGYRLRKMTDVRHRRAQCFMTAPILHLCACKIDGWP